MLRRKQTHDPFYCHIGALPTQYNVATCAGTCMDMCMGMCMDMRMSVHMSMYMSILVSNSHVCTHVHIAYGHVFEHGTRIRKDIVFLDMCADVFVDVCIDTRTAELWKGWPAPPHFHDIGLVAPY